MGFYCTKKREAMEKKTHSICRYLRRRPKTSRQPTPTTPLTTFLLFGKQQNAEPKDKKTLKL